jgi:hypothetical protein
VGHWPWFEHQHDRAARGETSLDKGLVHVRCGTSAADPAVTDKVEEHRVAEVAQPPTRIAVSVFRSIVVTYQGWVGFLAFELTADVGSLSLRI